MTCNEELSIIKLLNCNCKTDNTRTKDTTDKKDEQQFLSAWNNHCQPQFQENMVKAKQNIQKKRKKKASPKYLRKKKNFDAKIYNCQAKFGSSRNESSQQFSLSSVKNLTVPTTAFRNKATKNTGVLSYNSPSWRFITDKRYCYIERCHPKELIPFFNFAPRSKSSYNSKTKTQILDPAVFLDEKIAVAYKTSKSYLPDKTRIEVIRGINEMMNETYSDMTKRIVSKTVLNFLDNQSDGEEDKKTSGVMKRNTNNKCSFHRRKKCSENNLQEKDSNIPVLPIIKHIKEVKDELINNKKELYLPSISLPKVNPRAYFLKGPNKVYNSTIARQREITKQLIEGNSSSTSSYLPSLTLSNYKQKFYVPVRLESKEKNFSNKLLPSLDTPNPKPIQAHSNSVSKVNLS